MRKVETISPLKHSLTHRNSTRNGPRGQPRPRCGRALIPPTGTHARHTAQSPAPAPSPHPNNPRGGQSAARMCTHYPAYRMSASGGANRTSIKTWLYVRF